MRQAPNEGRNNGDYDKFNQDKGKDFDKSFDSKEGKYSDYDSNQAPENYADVENFEPNYIGGKSDGPGKGTKEKKKKTVKQIDTVKKITKSVEGTSQALTFTGRASKFIKMLGNVAGPISTISEVASNTVQLKDGEISTSRFSFRMIGTGTGAVIGTYIGGPPGFVVGVAVDVVFQATESAYDTIVPEIANSLNNFENTMKNACLNAK